MYDKAYGAQTTQYNPNAGLATPNQSGAVGGGGMDTPEQTPTMIRNKISDAEQLMSGIHALIDLVEKRFETVLLPNPPSTAQSTPSAPPSISSHVRGRLDLLNDGLYHAIARLKLLTDRADV